MDYIIIMQVLYTREHRPEVRMSVLMYNDRTSVRREQESNRVETDLNTETASDSVNFPLWMILSNNSPPIASSKDK